ncbi:TolB family protein [Polyangium aurulentum]|uniref:TolB family protein n=1 Tax=Polyangium aurulentum TaxID=2567896 RepID=UPI0010AEAC90|nr:hypothetical protein [Polyangium aurulentum]UQA60206.1 hypothetical protein E8A73_006920 [Polyangium aurulentum]
MHRRPAKTAIASLFAALAITAFGCGGAPPKPVRPARNKPVLRTDNNASRFKGPALLPAQIIARLDDEDAAPYLARRGDDALLFYTARGRWMTRLLGPNGAPKTNDPVDAAPAAAEIPVGAIEAVGDGYLAAWIEGTQQNSTVKALSLDAAGKPRGVPTVLAQSADAIAWVEILPNATGALIAWEVPREDDVDVIAAPYTPGKGAQPAVVLAHAALGWDTMATDRGAAIVTVVASPGDKANADAGRVGRVLFSEVDAAGKVSPPVTVSNEPTAQKDIVIAQAAGSYLVAWTDTRDIDASVYVAALQPGGKVVTAPKRATAPVGDQALVAVVSRPGASGSKRALLAWEDLLRAPREGRLIHLATMGPDAALGKERATLVFSASGPPDLAPDGDGFAAITLAPASASEEPPAKDAPILPTFVRFGPDLSVRAAEPVRAEPFVGGESKEPVPYLTRNLSCHAGGCTTLASTAGAPATLAMIDLPVRKSPWRAPAWREADDVPPRPAAVTALYDGDHLAEVSSAELSGGGSLVAWVTYFIEGGEIGKKPKKADDTLATLGIRAISPTGVPGQTQVLSRRAVSIGGVALAHAPSEKGPETALVWAQRDKNESQVQVAKLGPDGAKIAHKPLTAVPRKPSKEGVPSEVSDVAVAYAPPTDPAKNDDGWIVAWVDTRDGNAEIYVARVDRTLRKVVPDRRITQAPGDSAEVQIAVRGTDTFLVWSDARQSPEEGYGDIHAVRLDTRSLQKVGAETRLFASAAHSRSPSVSLSGNKVVVAWIEEAAAEAKPGEDPGVRVAMLDERGALAGPTQLVRGEEGSAVTSVALTCSGPKCRGVLTSALRETMILDAFELSPGAPPGPLKALATLTGGVNVDVSPSFAGPSASSLFFGDDVAGGPGRVRFMTIAWP